MTRNMGVKYWYDGILIAHSQFTTLHSPSSNLKSPWSNLKSLSLTLLPPSSVKRTGYLTQKVHCYQLFPALIKRTLYLDPAHWTCRSGLYFVILYLSYILESCQFQPFTLLIQKDSKRLWWNERCCFISLLPSSVKSRPSWTEIALLSLFSSSACVRIRPSPGIVSKKTSKLPRKLKFGTGPLFILTRSTS